MLIDLHTHTKCSDGLLTVEELVKKAAQKKVKILALTDHDTVEGLPLFIKICAKYKIQAIPGIELSTEIDGIELHIVGYLKNFYH
ncbi:MAG: PHP domain-containing protein, partial [Candidatus Magasanikbacteria bacterium]|nr:PHP domain-containing protein [Candidatus Magasanikbacteria bacterium]